MGYYLVELDGPELERLARLVREAIEARRRKGGDRAWGPSLGLGERSLAGWTSHD